MSKILRNVLAGVVVLCAASSAGAQTTCLSAGAAQSSASKIALASIQAERPQVNNPIVRDVRGPQCVDQYNTFGQIMQLLEQLPLGSTGDKILQIIMLLFGGVQNSCSVSNTQTAIPASGSAPTMSVVVPGPQQPTQYSGGSGSATSLYQSIFP